MITTRPVLLTVALLATAGCTSTSVSGQPATSTATTSTFTAAKSTEASTATATAMPLNNVEAACSLLNPATLPAAWQPLTVDPHPLLRLGDSNCSSSSPGRVLVWPSRCTEGRAAALTRSRRRPPLPLFRSRSVGAVPAYIETQVATPAASSSTSARTRGLRSTDRENRSRPRIPATSSPSLLPRWSPTSRQAEETS